MADIKNIADKISKVSTVTKVVDKGIKKIPKDKGTEVFETTIAAAEQKVSKIFDSLKTSLNDELDKLNNPVENLIEKAQQNIESSSKSSAQQSLQNIATSGAPSKETSEKKRARGKDEIDRHSEEGAIYVKKQNVVLDEPIDTEKNTIDTRVDETLDKENKKLSEMMAATSAGNKLAEYNNQVASQAKNIYSTIKTAESKAKNMAFTALQQSKLVVMAKLGVNLPV